jgi:hypothetical protein
MTTLLEVPADFARPQTGPEDEPRPGQLDLDPSGLPKSVIEVDRKSLEKALNRLKNSTQTTEGRLVALGYVVAHLPGVSRFETAEIVGVSEAKLNRWLHGVEQVPQNKVRRLLEIGTLLTKLHLILDEEATHTWLHSAIQDLAGSTPYELIRRGKVDRVEQVVDSYSDSSYG